MYLSLRVQRRFSGIAVDKFRFASLRPDLGLSRDRPSHKETDKKRKAPDTTEGGEGGEGVAAVKRSYVRSGATKMCPIRVAR